MRRFRLSAAALAVALVIGGVASGEGQGFAVIVNSANPIETVSRAQLSKIFLKQEAAWPDGQVIVPVDQPEDSSVRAEFSRVVLGRTVAAVKSFWQKQIFSGSAVPPLEKGSNSDVALYVSSFHGAVGYVGVIRQLSDGRSVVSLPPGVKVVRLVD